jgi:hypothetical protein
MRECPLPVPSRRTKRGDSPSSIARTVFDVPGALRAQNAAVEKAMRHGDRTVDGQPQVRLKCGYCQRRLDVLRVKGDGYQSLRARWPGYLEVAGPSAPGDSLRDRLFGPAGERVRYRCECGADHPMRRDKLTAAVLRAASRDKRHRVVVIPDDL